MRSPIIAYFELTSSFEGQATYQGAAPHINVADEITSQWEDRVHEDWRSHITEPVFSPQEVEAIAGDYTAWEAALAATQHRLPPFATLLANREWPHLAS